MKDQPFANVIVTYNNAADVPGLLEDLRAHAPGSRTVLIDNASLDGTSELVSTSFPEVKLVRNRVNVGYARAVNQGFGYATTPYVFLLNPDIRIASPRVFQELLHCLERDRNVAVAGPLQFKTGGRRKHLNFTWSYITPSAFRIYLSHRLGSPLQDSSPIRVAFLNAGCLFIRRAAFEEVGHLNEKYFLYGEEPDLFLKLMRHGFECRLVPSASITHSREQSIRTVPPFQRLKHRMQGILNIADAVTRGVMLLVLDRITSRGSR